MQKQIYHTPLVVAKKGVRGFIKTRCIDQTTTICDNRVKKVHSLQDALILLTGYGGIAPEPVCLNLENVYISNKILKINTLKITHIIKMVIGKWKDEVFTGVLIDNSNNRYQVECAYDGTIQKLIPVQTYEEKIIKKYAKDPNTTLHIEREAKIICIGVGHANDTIPLVVGM